MKVPSMLSILASRQVSLRSKTGRSSIISANRNGKAEPYRTSGGTAAIAQSAAAACRPGLPAGLMLTACCPLPSAFLFLGPGTRDPRWALSTFYRAHRGYGFLFVGGDD